MASANFALEGSDPSLSADVLPSLDTGVNPSDPLQTLVFDSANTDTGTPIYGPSLQELGLSPSAGPVLGSGDPSAYNASPTTAVPTSPTTLDSILKIGSFATSLTTALSGRGTAAITPTNANRVTNAKSPTKGAGTSSGLVWFAIALFIGIALWLEFKH